MPELDPQAVLSAYRESLGPASHAKAAAKATVANRIAAGDPGMTLASSVGAAGLGTGSVLKIIGALALVAGVGIARWAIVSPEGSSPAPSPTGRPVTVSAAPEQQEPPEEVTPDESAERQPLLTPPPAVPRAVTPTDDTPASLEAEDPKPTPRRQARPGRSHDTERGKRTASSSADRKPEKNTAVSSTLGEELSLLSAGQRALNGGEPKRALAKFERHASQFPNGELAPEREVKRIAALCALDRTDEADEVAKAFSKRYPGSPLVTKARQGCR